MSRDEIIRSEDAAGIKTQPKRVEESKVEVGKKSIAAACSLSPGVHNIMIGSNHAVETQVRCNSDQTPS